ncbi:MAG TPA: DALR anticodon-binding domain-containing protein, partial [Rhizomicrobium sp.]|nr:DALR anticodon-binding domain-containing protein [Rhizomicrobium sp.]
EGAAMAAPAVHSAEERKLILQLLSLGDVLKAAEDKRAPNMLCEYAFELAQNFSRFYGEHHILSEADQRLKASRLGLCALVLAVLTGVLDLLGIEIPERM